MSRLSRLLLASASISLLSALSLSAAAAADGANGGTVDVTLTYATGGDVDSSGGPGDPGNLNTPSGDGGQGGHVTAHNDEEIDTIDITVDGGHGGDGAQIVPGGTGGAGGTIDLTVNGRVDHGIVLSAKGGEGGNGSADGPGGAGGTINVTINAQVGNAHVDAPSVLANAGAGQNSLGSNGQIVITLETGAVLEGPVKTVGTQYSTLRFAMTVKSRADLEAARAYLADANNTSSGTVVINGNTYSWLGIGQLVDLLRTAGTSFGATAAVTSDYLHCLPGGKVIAIKQGDAVVFNARNPDGGAYFRVGAVSATTFVSANPLGWTVSLVSDHHKTTAQVLDGTGALVATCKL